MIKKLFLTVVIFLGAHSYAIAQGYIAGYKNAIDSMNEEFSEFATLENIDEVLSKSTSSSDITPEEIIEIKKNLDIYITETVTEAIYTLPEIYWQYIVPVLYVTPFLPDALLNKPEFLAYKGKKPTIIDPAKQGYADKYLDDMNPILYAYLIPDVMPGEEEYVPKTMKEGIQIFSKTLPKQYPPKVFLEDLPRSKMVDLAFAAEPSEKYASGEYLNEKPDTGRSDEITADSDLRGGDIIEFLKSLPKASLVAEKDTQVKHADVNMLKKMIDRLMNFEKYNAIPVNPCSDFVKSLHPELSSGFDLILKDYGFNKEEWGYVCDKTIKAYRLYSINAEKLGAIFDLHLERENTEEYNKMSERAKKSLNNELENVKNMYRGNPDDINVIKWYMKDVKKSFDDSKFLDYLKIGL